MPETSKPPLKLEDMDAAQLALIFDDLNEDAQDRIAEKWCDRIYYCTQCDEAGLDDGQCQACVDYPRDHDESGYRGTGTDYDPATQALAHKIRQS